MRSDTGTTLPIAGWWITNGRLSAEAFRLLCALALRLTVVGERDSPTQVDLGATLNMSVRSVRRNLLVLEQAGVVRCGKEGRRRTYTLVYQSPHVHATPDTAVPYSYDPLVPEATPLPAVNRYSRTHGQRTVAYTDISMEKDNTKGNTYQLERATSTAEDTAPPDQAPSATPLARRATPRFDELYGLWPRQENRTGAKRVAMRLHLEEDTALWDQIKLAAQRWTRFWNDPHDPVPIKFVPHLGSWLKNQRYLDTVPLRDEPHYAKQTRTIAEASAKFLAAPEEDDLL